MRKLNDPNIADWNYVANKTSSIQSVTSKRVVFNDPIKNVKMVFNSLREGGIYMQDLYKQVLSNPKLLKQYRSLGILFSRREMTKICEKDNNPYLYYEKVQKN